MGWDSSGNHILLTAPVSLGDVSYACGVGGTSYDLGYMIANGTAINAAAKYKPVSVAEWGILTEAQRKSVHWGLGATLPELPQPTSSNSYNPQAVLTYTKPSGGSSSQYRALDFAKDTTSTTAGYDSHAVWPLAIKVWDISKSYAAVSIFVNQLVNSSGIDLTQREWRADRSLSIADFFDVSNDSQGLYTRYISFYVINVSTGAVNLVKTRLRLQDVVSDGYYNFSLYGTTTTAGGYTFPEIPVIKNATAGTHTIRIIGCLASGAPTSGYEYSVITSSFPSVVSLEFETDWDRGAMVIRSSDPDLAGVTVAIGSTITITRTNETVSASGVTFRKFVIEYLTGVYNTSNVSGSLSPYAVANAELTITSANSHSIISTSGPESGNTTMTDVTQTPHIVKQTTDQVDVILENTSSSPHVINVWLISSVYSSDSISFSLKLTQGGVTKGTSTTVTKPISTS